MVSYIRLRPLFGVICNSKNQKQILCGHTIYYKFSLLGEVNQQMHARSDTEGRERRFEDARPITMESRY